MPASHPLRAEYRWLFGAVAALTFVSATAIVAYHAHTPIALIGGALYTFCFAIGAWWLLSLPEGSSLRSWVASPSLWIALLLLLAVVDQHHYLKARRLPSFASSAEALERPARALLHGNEPYQFRIGGYPAGPSADAPSVEAPISPGPGWVILLSPLTASTATGLLASVVLAIVLSVLGWRNRFVAGAFLLLLLAQPVFFFQSESGQDLYDISLVLVLLAVLASELPATLVSASLLGLLAGFVATSRVPMLLPVMVIGLGYYRKNRRAGAAFLLLSCVSAIALHLGFALWSHQHGHFYQPMHVFHRGANGSGLVSRAFAALLFCAALFWILRRMKGNAADWCAGAALVMAALFIPEALKELAYARALNWEGSTYITFPVPLLIAAFVLHKSWSQKAQAG